MMRLAIAHDVVVGQQCMWQGLVLTSRLPVYTSIYIQVHVAAVTFNY